MLDTTALSYEASTLEVDEGGSEALSLLMNFPFVYFEIGFEIVYYI